ncbi:MAG: cobalamin biosynthesis protein CobQ [Sulfitobacter sp.]|nr:cobalamin biosynthesis protein CobQ [Sulfitobacter sp.]
MNTPAHLLLGGAVMGRQGRHVLVWAGIAGGLVPDLSLYLLAGISLFLLDIPPRIVFDELYFSDTWQTIFAIDNSVLLWGAAFALALWSGRAWAMAFTGAALLHLALDFPLHHDDGRPHFWPATGWIFESPYSYWDRAHGALWIGPVEVVLALLCGGLILWRRPGLWLSLLTLALMASQLAVARVWQFVFAG